jgi:methyl-accepting chemotaxis protein
MNKPVVEDLAAIVREQDDVVRLERLTHHIQRIREDMAEMRSSMKEMAAAITRVALVEERLSNAHIAMDRMGKVIDKLEDRVATLETKQPEITKTTMWVDKGIMVIVFVAFTFIAVKTGLL